ncbi:MAG: hypothetical protein ACOX9C_01950 [Kiritimatiellia bacterium]|jgi:hypothetical protein
MNRNVMKFVAAVAVAAGLAAPQRAKAAVLPLFSDDFSYATSGSMSKPSTRAWTVPPAGYVEAVLVYDAGGAVKLGKTDFGGKLTTTNMMFQTGTVNIQVDAAGWDSGERTFSVTVAGQVRSFTVNAVRPTLETVTATVQVEACASNIVIKSVERMIIDNVIITETVYDTNEPAFTLLPNPVPSVYAGGTVEFSLTAAVTNAPMTVTYASGLPQNADYTYDGTNFVWNTVSGQVGAYDLEFQCSCPDGTYFHTVPVTVEAMPLVAPSVSVDANDYSFVASWDAVPAASGYIANVWYGSCDTNSVGVDLETFWETELAGKNVAPVDWTFTGLGSPYTNKELKFDDTDDTIISRRYPKAVTELAFYLKGNSTTLTNNSVFTVYGSADETTWEEVASYSSLADGDGDDSNNIVTSGAVNKTLPIDESAGYRRFKFVYTKEKGNVAFDNLGAKYPGAGPVFVSGWRDAPVAGTSIAVNALPTRVYWVQIGATDGVETLFTTTSLKMGPAQKTTLFVIK